MEHVDKVNIPHYTKTTRCAGCGGTGKVGIVKRPCPWCMGKGKLPLMTNDGRWDKR